MEKYRGYTAMQVVDVVDVLLEAGIVVCVREVPGGPLKPVDGDFVNIYLQDPGKALERLRRREQRGGTIEPGEHDPDAGDVGDHGP